MYEICGLSFFMRLASNFQSSFSRSNSDQGARNSSCVRTKANAMSLRARFTTVCPSQLSMATRSFGNSSMPALCHVVRTLALEASPLPFTALYPEDQVSYVRRLDFIYMFPPDHGKHGSLRRALRPRGCGCGQQNCCAGDVKDGCVAWNLHLAPPWSYLAPR